MNLRHRVTRFITSSEASPYVFTDGKAVSSSILGPLYITTIVTVWGAIRSETLLIGRYQQ